MKKIVLLLAGLTAVVSLKAQGGYSSPADTVYLQYGNTATVHIRKIEPSKAGAVSAYQIKTHESLDLSDSNIWSNTEGGYQWTAEQFIDGFRSGEVRKVVFADGFVLPFEGGEMDRGLLLKAPSFQASHGDFMAEGVIPLTQEETRELIGDAAYYLNYKVRKNQARLGMAKFILGASSGFACYLFRDNAVITKEITSLVGTGRTYVGSAEYKYNPLWQTGTAAAAVTAVYGVAEMALANGSIHKLASDFRDYEAPSAGSFRTKAILGGGLVLAGGAVAYLGYNRIAKDAGWSETYTLQTTAGVETAVKTGETGKKMAAPWLLPAAGALLANFGLTELTNGLTGLSGYAKLRTAGLARAEFRVAPVPYGMGVSMVF